MAMSQTQDTQGRRRPEESRNYPVGRKAPIRRTTSSQSDDSLVWHHEIRKAPETCSSGGPWRLARDWGRKLAGAGGSVGDRD